VLRADSRTGRGVLLIMSEKCYDVLFLCTATQLAASWPRRG
jgi:hypothetical protein